MLTVEPIASIDDPRLAPYRTMRAQRDHHEQRIFVAEGEKIVRRLLQNRIPVVSVLLPQKWLADFRPLLEAREPAPAVFLAEKAELEKLTGFSMYQGLLAVGKVPDAVPLPVVLQTTAAPRLLVAADTLHNSENLGALVRNAAAFGAQALIVGETCSSPYLRRAVRSSMGTIFSLPVVEPDNLPELLGELRRHGFHTVAAHPHTDQRTLYDARLTGDCCLVFGNEGAGISPEVLAVCDEAVAIPMAPGIDSLNVGSAAAAFLSEVFRQRRAATQ